MRRVAGRRCSGRRCRPGSRLRTPLPAPPLDAAASPRRPKPPVRGGVAAGSGGAAQFGPRPPPARPRGRLPPAAAAARRRRGAPAVASPAGHRRTPARPSTISTSTMGLLIGICPAARDRTAELMQCGTLRESWCMRRQRLALEGQRSVEGPPPRGGGGCNCAVPEAQRLEVAQAMTELRDCPARAVQHRAQLGRPISTDLQACASLVSEVWSAGAAYSSTPAERFWRPVDDQHVGLADACVCSRTVERVDVVLHRRALGGAWHAGTRRTPSAAAPPPSAGVEDARATLQRLGICSRKQRHTVVCPRRSRRSSSTKPPPPRRRRQCERAAVTLIARKR